MNITEFLSYDNDRYPKLLFAERVSVANALIRTANIKDDVSAFHVEVRRPEELAKEILNAAYAKGLLTEPAYLSMEACAYIVFDLLQAEGKKYEKFEKNKSIRSVDVASSQSHIRQMVEHICANVSGTDVDLAEAMGEYIKHSLEHELSLSENPDAVRFMNLHKTKGLEGNIVILLNRRRLWKNPISSCRDKAAFYPGTNNWTSLESFPEVKKSEEEAEKAEFHRLEYLAVTRAKQAVIFMGVIERGGPFAGTALSEYRKENDVYVYRKVDKTTYDYRIRDEQNIDDLMDMGGDAGSQNAKDPLQAKDYPMSEDGFLSTPSEEKEEKEKQKFIEKLSPSGLERTSKALQEERKENRETQAEDYSKCIDRPKGNVMGDILHNAMQLYILEKGVGSDATVGEEKKRECIRQAIQNHSTDLHKIEVPEGDDAKAVLKAFIYACICSYEKYLESFWADVARIYPEVSFSYSTKQDEKTIWMNGTADLILQMRDGTYRLIDYKSDNDCDVSEETMVAGLREKYTPQIQEYKKIIQKMLGAEPSQIQAGLISFSQKDENGIIQSGAFIRTRDTEMS